MNSSFKPVAVIVVAVLVLASFSLYRSATAGPEVIPWRSDFDAAKAEAAQTGKPLFLYFTASWCPNCREMEQGTWSDPRAKDALEQFVPVKIDVDANPSLARDYGVRGIPHSTIADASGAAQRIRGGVMSVDKVVEWVRK